VKNRSYLGDGVYISFNADGAVVLELEQGRGIILTKDTFHSLIEFVHKNQRTFDPHCQLLEIPHQCFDQVVGELKELEAVATRGGTKLQ